MLYEKKESGIDKLLYILKLSVGFDLYSAFILAPPGPPIPRVTDTSSTTIELEWEPPAFNGGGEIIGYFVDKQLVGTNEWSRCTEKMIKVRQYTVKEIREGADYKLRVSAVNAAGEGPPGETEPVTVAEPQGTQQLYDTDYGYFPSRGFFFFFLYFLS